jgi:hypothetical protein
MTTGVFHSLVICGSQPSIVSLRCIEWIKLDRFVTILSCGRATSLASKLAEILKLRQNTSTGAECSLILPFRLILWISYARM